jgi:hypothetical protein
MVQAWKDRAVQLNALPPQGQFTNIPPIIYNQAAIINCLNYSLKDFASYMHCLIKRDPRQRNSKMSPLYYRMFGKERVIMGKQLYCSHFFNHLLYVVFFGEWLNHSFHPFELISSTRNTKLIHIGSAKRLIEMTEVNGLSPFQVTSYNNSQKYREKNLLLGKLCWLIRFQVEKLLDM